MRFAIVNNVRVFLVWSNNQNKFGATSVHNHMATYLKWNHMLIRNRACNKNGVRMALKGLFTSWIMKLSQGLVRYVVGCPTRLGITSIYTKESMSEWPWNQSHITLSWVKIILCACMIKNHFVLTKSSKHDVGAKGVGVRSWQIVS